MNDYHIIEAIKQAKKEGNKMVTGFVGGIEENHKYTKLLNEGKLEIFCQKYRIADGMFSTVLLMRKPKTK